jgi:protein SCO1/2
MVQTGKPRSGTGTKAHNDAGGGGAKARSVHKRVRPPRAADLMGFSAVAISGARDLGVLILGAMALSVLSLAACGPSTQPVESYGEARIGGPFTMVDQNGRHVDQRVLLGKWSAVFFGYTYCPDTCPATLSALAAAQARLGAAAKTFQVVFVSVDPARDTPAQMKLYLSAQGLPALGSPGGALGLTGSPTQVADIAKAYAAIYAKVGAGPDYQVQHSAAIYLMDPQGKFARPLSEAQGPVAMAKQIADAMQHN